MGNFYANVAVQTEDRDAILAALPLSQDPGVLGPTENGWTVVSSAALDTQDETAMFEYGVALSRDLGSKVIGATNHDDDALMMWVFDQGADVAFLNTAPGALTGEDLPAVLRGVEHFATAAGRDDETMRALLLAPTVFAVEHHQQIVTSLGLPAYAAGFGFRYTERGEFAHLDLVKFGH